MLSSRQIIAVLATVRHKNISLAAAEIGMSRSGLSRALTQAEAALGVKLFDRSRVRISLTPHGELIFPLLNQIDGLYERLRCVDDLRQDSRRG